MRKLKLFFAYLFVILLWATTPLAIKWSAEGAGFVFSVTLRMAIGTLILFSILVATGTRLPWHKKAVLTYIAIAIQIYGAMMAVYWSSRFIPSGWVSVIFGLTPFITAILAAWLLREKSLSLAKISTYILSLCGLALMFSSALDLNFQALQGISGVLLAALLHSISSVWVKRIKANLSSLVQVAGGLLFAMPVYLVSWYLHDQASWPLDMPLNSLLAIVYLGLLATSFGFVMYYYILTHQPATRVAMVTILSPVLALWLGYSINGEIITVKVAAGTTMILTALFLNQLVDRKYRKKRKRKAPL